MLKTLVSLLVLGAGVVASTAEGQTNTTTTNSQPERVWISIGADAVSLINQKYAKQFNLNQISLHNSSSGGVAVVSIPESKLDALSELMHHQFNRCAGFVFHENYNEAQAFANTPQQFTAELAVNYTIDNPDGVNALLNQLNSSNLTSTVNSLSNFHNRYYTQQSGSDAANWIKNQWASIASGRSDISVEVFNHSWLQPSVIATITGTTTPNEVVVIGGHLDSINQSSPSSGRAPGSDDNASGIAVATETLRAIVASDFKPAKTVKLMGYAAEEVGLRGSKAIAQDHRNNNIDVIGVAQFDMTGYKGTSNRDIVFMTDYTNNAQNNFMMQLIDTYLSGVSYGTDQCGYACSDHASWHNEGFAASMPFEANMGQHNSRIHTSSDNTFDANHAINFAKLSVAFVAELAKGTTDGNPPPPPPSDNELKNGEAETNLSATAGQDIVYTMEVPANATDIKFVTTGGTGDADLYVKFGSAPTDSSYDCRPYKNGNEETCTGTSTGGTYHVRVKAYSNFSGLSLTGSYSDGTPPPPGNEPINETINNISVSQGQWQHYTQELGDGYADLSVTISGGSGDADLYVRHGAESTLTQYDCRPYRNGNNETCSFNLPAAGTWYIDLRGYSTSSGVTLNIQANP